MQELPGALGFLGTNQLAVRVMVYKQKCDKEIAVEFRRNKVISGRGLQLVREYCEAAQKVYERAETLRKRGTFKDFEKPGELPELRRGADVETAIPTIALHGAHDAGVSGARPRCCEGEN